MTFSIHGIGVSRGIAIGRVHIIERDQLEIREYKIVPERIDAEIRRLDEAVRLAAEQLRAVRDHIPKHTAADIAVFIDTHLLMLEDTALTQEPARLIRERRCNAEWALKLQRDALVAVFDEMDDPYLSTRRDDVDHVVNRIQRTLQKQSLLEHEVPDSRLNGCIVLADDLTPADTVLMEHHGIAAFATEYGGPTSHTAILARSLGIPSIVGLHHARRYVREGDVMIVDGTRGIVLVDPDSAIEEYYRKKQSSDRRYLAELINLKEAASKTRDGQSIGLYANIEIPRDFETVREVGAAGVGLYRTEFLFMNRKAPPDEEEQYENYCEVLSGLDGKVATIRTLDLGADKQVDGGGRDGPVGSNPALGLRAVRLCLKDPSLFRPQLRAIIRASAVGPVRMMVPMLSNLHETRQILHLVDQVRGELRARGLDFDPHMPIGGMIEVPAAAICADAFAEQLDFLSIGTNDLIQYTMAIDRVNEEVNYLYDPLNPAVLRLIKMVIDAGATAKIPVAMCGEMAGDPRYVRLLLALGLHEFSVHPGSLLEVKRIIIDTDLSRIGSFGEELLSCRTGSEVATLVESIN